MGFRFQAAIFDMDGTMIDNAPFHDTAWVTFARNNGIRLSKKKFREKFYGRHNSEILPNLFNKKLNPEEINIFTQQKEEIYRQKYKPYLREVTGLKKLLEKLRNNNYKVAIATTSPKDNCDFVLEGLGLSDYFDEIVSAEDVSKGKPDPEVYQTALNKLGMSASQAVVFEDSPVGVAAAKTAGIFTVAVLTCHTKDELSQADQFVQHFEEILDSF